MLPVCCLDLQTFYSIVGSKLKLVIKKYGINDSEIYLRLTYSLAPRSAGVWMGLVGGHITVDP